MTKIFDIVVCPACSGEKEVESGQVMKNNKVYTTREQCQRCKGKGRIGIERKDELAE